MIDSGPISGVEIVLDRVTKSYPDQPEPAVDAVQLTIAAGETVVLVGPSGCGKTTTLRMINRLIEPTSGTITIDGVDTKTVDANRLRRGIGYAIQQGGLFPHMTVGKNIATVPGLLGWKRRRIAERVDEMLELVGLAPAEYRDRYPRQLSGGQQQRVGVARALAADPPVLLMDEPFGAVDPVTRGLLQDELLRVQAELHKTIVFVTHDISEAIKLGDRIAVLGPRSRILQYDPPATLLAAPADDTVARFVGADASLKQLTLARVDAIELRQCPTVTEDEPVVVLRKKLAAQQAPWGLVLDAGDRPVRWVSAAGLAQAQNLSDIGEPVHAGVSGHSTLQDALTALLTNRAAMAVVTGTKGEYQGLITVASLVEYLTHLNSGDDS